MIKVPHIFSGDLWAGADVVIFNLLTELSRFSNIRVYALSLNHGVLTQRLSEKGITLKVVPESKTPLF